MIRQPSALGGQEQELYNHTHSCGKYLNKNQGNQHLANNAMKKPPNKLIFIQRYTDTAVIKTLDARSTATERHDIKSVLLLLQTNKEELAVMGPVHFKIINTEGISCRSQWPRGLRRGSAAARLLGLWVRIPQVTWMSVCCECCVLPGRGLCDGLITRPEESYRLCVSVSECDIESSVMRRPWHTGGYCAMVKKKNIL